MREIVRALLELLANPQFAQSVQAAVQTLLPPFWRNLRSDPVAQLSTGEIADFGMDLKTRFREHLDEGSSVVETCAKVQKMFHTVGLNDSTIQSATALVVEVDRGNITLKLPVGNVLKLLSVDLDKLRTVVELIKTLLSTVENPNDINPLEMQYLSAAEKESGLLKEFLETTAVDNTEIILFLVAQPLDLPMLRLNKEFREIDEVLAHQKMRRRIVVEPHMAVRKQDLLAALRLAKPDIVHISSHGGDSNAIYFEDDSGMKAPISTDLLESLFMGHEDDILAVVLNACNSSEQAKAIARHIQFAVGMSGDLTDDSAIAFSRGFYQSYGSGDDLDKAFRQGCLEVRFRETKEENVPMIFRRTVLQ